MQGTSADLFRKMPGWCDLNSDIKEGSSGIAEYAWMMLGMQGWSTKEEGVNQGEG